MTTDIVRRGEDSQALQQTTKKELTLEMVADMTGYAPAQIALVSRTVATGAPLQELAVFLHACKTLQLDPLLRQAYWIRRSSGGVTKGALQVGIDGFRAIAERSGAYAGSEPPRFLGQIEVVYQGRSIIAPDRAQVVVWKIVQGHKAAFTGEANWAEFYPGDKDGFMYRKMPRHMLAKDAEAQALRKAFPALLGAIQVVDVDDGALPIVEVEAEPQQRRKALAESYDRAFGADEAHAFAEFPTDVEDESQDPVPPVAEQTRAESWAENRRLGARAAELGLSGVPIINNRSTTDVLAEANADLAERIQNAERDQQAQRESEQGLL